MEKATLNIEGMSCSHCVSAVRRALSGIAGVSVERVEVGSATIGYDPERTSLDKAIGAVNDEGYRAQLVE